MNNKRKRGLAIIYDPHNLFQFIWYYCTHGTEYEWDALCLPNGYKGEYMSKYCEKSGIFQEIYKDSKAFLTTTWQARIKIFLEMLRFALAGKQSKYCKKLLKNYVDIEQYEMACVLTDVGIVSGAIIGLGKEMRIAILEDGMGDYADRPKGYIRKHLRNAYDWQGYLLAKMGYANPGHYYRLKTTKYCEKYCSNPNQMLYREYKNIDKLYDFSKTDMQLYDSTIQNVYDEITKCDFGKADAVIFTNRLMDFGDNMEAYIQKFEEYVNKHYKSIILKRHPRDETKYEFDSHILVQEIDNSVPAEVILTKIREKQILFMFTSSILLYMQDSVYNMSFLYFEDLYKSMLNEKTYLKYLTKQEMIDYLGRFGLDKRPIISI